MAALSAAEASAEASAAAAQTAVAGAPAAAPAASELLTSYSNTDASDSASAGGERLAAQWQAKLAERAAAQREKQEARARAANPDEDVDAFHARFRVLASSVEDGLSAAREQSAAGGLGRAELASSLGALKAVVADMQAQLAKATLFLAAYDVRLCSEKIAKADVDIESARSTLAPRRKFAFGKKSKAAAAAKVEEAKVEEAKVESKEGAGAVEKKKTALSSISSDELVVQDKVGETIVIGKGGASDAAPASHSDSDSHQQDIRLQRLTDCTVYLLQPSGAVRFLHLERCRLFVGPVSGSCFFEECKDCTFMITARQIRIHDSTRCNMYLHVLSRPIIEHCSALAFAPNVFEYPHLEPDLVQAKLERAKENDLWQHVHDFRWLRQQQSPNWSIIPTDERLPPQKWPLSD